MRPRSITGYPEEKGKRCLGGVREVRVRSGNCIMGLIIYTKTGCPWCKDALDFLHEKRVSFEEREVRGNKTWFDEMVKKSGQTKAPTLDLDGDILADTDREAIQLWLAKKGML